MERQALTLAVNNSNENERLALKKHLDGFLNGLSEEEQIENDRLLHLQLVRMSGNRLVIANYTALTRIIDRSIRDMRRKIHTESPIRFGQYQDVHRNPEIWSTPKGHWTSTFLFSLTITTPEYTSLY